MEIVIFGLAGLALLSVGSTALALLFGGVTALNLRLSFALKQRPGDGGLAGLTEDRPSV